jgi:hypothetical protein
MPDEPKLKRAIDAGLKYLAENQLKNGSFASFSSPSQQPFRPVKTYHTNFVPAVILAAISASEGSPVTSKTSWLII